MIIIFDLPDSYGLGDEQLSKLVEDTPLYTLGSKYQWYRHAHIENVVVDIPDQPEGDTDVQPT